MTDAEDEAKALFFAALDDLDAGANSAAETRLGEVLKLVPERVSVLTNLAVALFRQRRFAEAAENAARAVVLDEADVDAQVIHGSSLAALERPDEALAAFDRAVALAPDHAEAWLGRGNALAMLGRLDEALGDFEKALANDPDAGETWIARGNLLARLDRRDEASDAFDRALASDPSLADAWLGKARLHAGEKAFDRAVAAYRKAIEARPGAETLAALVHARMHLCDWDGLEDDWAALRKAAAEDADDPPNPFYLLSIPASGEEQLATARAYVRRLFPPVEPPLWNGEGYTHERVRVAYISPDYRKHATALLTAGLFERHSRQRFETVAISTGPDDGSEMRQRLTRAFDRFVDVHDRSDADVARLLRELEIDIAVDLAGHTSHSRPGIMARRPAPVQVSYLGYPGTTGADYYDYIVADETVIPEGDHALYSEAVVALADSYQVNDAARQPAQLTGTRADHGLPDDGFVFCSFSDNYKITPQVFDIWMRLLANVEGSVLWLLEGNHLAPDNLRREAVKRGVAAERLVFAPRMKLEDHVDRHRHADLFLDTLIYNGHTTVSDALWAGLPVVTCPGDTFASRVGASLVSAAHLPEMATDTLAEYEALALKLAREPDVLSAVHRKLIANRTICPLFDTGLFTERLEQAYAIMANRTQRGERHEAFTIRRMEV